MGTDATVGRRELNKQRTRERLLDAARDLLADSGANSTVEEIAERAAVSRATFFNYFPSKDDLLTALYRRHIDAFTIAVDDLLSRELTTAERIVALFTDFIREADEIPGYLRTVTGEIERISSSRDLLAERGRVFTGQIQRIIEPGVASGEVRTDFPADFLAQMTGAVYLSTIRFWQQDPEFDLGERFALAARYAAESLAPRGPGTN